MSNGTGDDKEKTKFLLFGGASSEKDWAEVSEIDLVLGGVRRRRVLRRCGHIG
jgi:hypothetical protein